MPPGLLVVCVSPRRNAILYVNIDFLTCFTRFLAGQKTTVKLDTFDTHRAHVRHPRFLAILNGKKHSPPPCAALVTRLAGWVVRRLWRLRIGLWFRGRLWAVPRLLLQCVYDYRSSDRWLASLTVKRKSCEASVDFNGCQRERGAGPGEWT